MRLSSCGTQIGSGKGFTLIEILLAMTLFTIVMTSAYGIFSMGLQVWKHAQSRSGTERKAVLALERISKDLRNAVRVQDEAFKGKGSQREIYIPALIPVKNSQMDMFQFGWIHYRLEPFKNQICRREYTASAIDKRAEPECRPIAFHVRDLNFRYLIYKGVGDSYSWLDSWDSGDDMPLAVEVSFTTEEKLKREKTSTQVVYKKTVPVYAGGRLTPELLAVSSDTPADTSQTPMKLGQVS